MLTTLTILGNLLAPGNILIFALMLAFAPSRECRMRLPGKIFAAWISLSAVSCFYSTQSVIAFMGTMYRVAGFFYWIMLARLGYLFWAHDRSRLNNFSVVSMAGCAIFLFFVFLNGKPPTADVMMSGFGSVCFAILAVSNPILSIVPIGCSILVGTRTGLLVVAMMSVYLSFSTIGRKYIGFILSASAVVVFLLGMMMLNDGSAARSSVMKKLGDVNVCSFGSGARSSWIIQAYDIVRKWPVEKRLIGDGFDTIVFHLRNPGGVMRPDGAPDRTHNVAMDIILQTGVLGYTLSLLCLASCIHCVLDRADDRNKMCLAGILAWIVFGMFNPQGAAADAMMVCCVFGMREKHDC